MSRDWQQDMEIIESYLEFRHLSYYPEQKLAGVPVVYIIQYWLQQYAAEKERADKAEAEAEKWRREALRKYPTPDAYDAACVALHKHRERADRTEVALLQMEESIAWIKTKYEFEWTFEPGIGEVVNDIINVLENGTGVVEGKK